MPRDMAMVVPWANTSHKATAPRGTRRVLRVIMLIIPLDTRATLGLCQDTRHRTTLPPVTAQVTPLRDMLRDTLLAILRDVHRRARRQCTPEVVQEAEWPRPPEQAEVSLECVMEVSELHLVG